MTSSGRDRARTLAGALAQVVAGLTAHALAAGCLPPGPALVVSLPAALLGVLLVGALLRDSPLRALAAGQLTVHACLAASACAVASLPSHAAAADPAAHGTPHLLMTAAHVGALVLCRATGDAVLRGTDVAVDTLVRLVRALVPAPRLPSRRLPGPVLTALPAPRRDPERHARPPRRGPPAVVPRLVPA